MFAELAGEPWHLRPWEIARLTWRQVATHYKCPRDKEGRPLPSQRPVLGATATRAEAWAAMAAMGISADHLRQLDAQWRARYGGDHGAE
jgi:hypothetical protein